MNPNYETQTPNSQTLHTRNPLLPITRLCVVCPSPSLPTLPRSVCVQGMLGANFGPTLLTMAGVHNTIARGLAAAATAGGLGTASLTAKVGERGVGWGCRQWMPS